MTIQFNSIQIQFTFSPVVSGCLCFVMSTMYDSVLEYSIIRCYTNAVIIIIIISLLMQGHLI